MIKQDIFNLTCCKNTLLYSICVLLAFTIFPVYAQVDISDNNYADFFDINEIYTIVGAVKNHGNDTVIPTLHFTINDTVQSFKLVPISPHSEFPFKVKFPQVINPISEKPVVSFTKYLENTSIAVDVIYDDTLIVHNDGHQSGSIVNNGNSTISNIKVYALIYDIHGTLLDMGQNAKMIQQIRPDQVIDFTIYPDPAIAHKAVYYSCFAIGDSTVIPITTERKGQQYDFRYDSGNWFAYSTFSDDGSTLSMRTQNNWPLGIYANFEFPKHSDTEKFHVTLDNKPIDFIQSQDDSNNWHVAFILDGYTQGQIDIEGFQDDILSNRPVIPSWIKDNASWWSKGQIDDSSFVSAIKYLISKGVIQISSSEDTKQITIPNWVKTSAGWWAEGKITDKEFVNALQFLIRVS